MDVLTRPSQRRSPAAIDPAKAWMLGLVVEDDGTLLPAPAAAPPAFGALDEGRRQPIRCTCPDYCELEHDAV